MKRSTSFRFSDEALRILALLARRHGLSQTALLEMLLRHYKEKRS